MIKVEQLEMFEDRVLVKPIKEDDDSVKGFIVPESAQEKPQFGVIIDAGPGTPEKPTKAKKGDTVFYGKYAGLAITVGEESFLVMREADIAARIRPAVTE
jgi:chaperonin GroES